MEWMKPTLNGYQNCRCRSDGRTERNRNLFRPDWDKIKQTVSSFWEWIKPYVEVALRATVAVVTGGLSELVIFVVQHWDEIRSDYRGMGSYQSDNSCHLEFHRRLLEWYLGFHQRSISTLVSDA